MGGAAFGVRVGALAALLVGTAFAAQGGAPTPPYSVTVVDEVTQRGVPMVTLTTVHHVEYVTDSAGVAVLREPPGRWFYTVESPGYEFQKDGFGFRGKALEVRPGGRDVLKLRRTQPAERLYRVTGAERYRDSLEAGLMPPVSGSELKARVLGSDSVVNAVLGGRLYWFWGDTLRPEYPLGNFHVPGATSLLPSAGGLAPDQGVELDYALDANGFARETAHLPGEGPTWITGLFVLKEGARVRLFGFYSKIRGFLEAYERGLIEFDPQAFVWKKVAPFPLKAPAIPGGHTFLGSATGSPAESGPLYVYFCNPFPNVRVRATLDAVRNPAAYEAFGCLPAGKTVPASDRHGRAHYAWRRGAPTVSPADELRFIRTRKLARAEARFLPSASGRDGARRDLQLAAGSVNWNTHRQRFVMIAVQLKGASMLGEVW